MGGLLLEMDDWPGRVVTPITPKETKLNGAANVVEGSDIVRLWIHPGSFSKLPLTTNSTDWQDDSSTHRFFETPIMCIGAGTGIAPLRSLILEREA